MLYAVQIGLDFPLRKYLQISFLETFDLLIFYVRRSK